MRHMPQQTSILSKRKNAYTKEDLLACGRGELFETNSPRLPVGHMLMTDRIKSINTKGGKYGRGELIAELDIRPDMWFFGCHFLNDPVMPGCLGLDALWQLTGFYLAWLGYHGQGRALGADSVRFSGEIPPESSIVEYHLHMRRVFELGLTIGLADATVSVDGAIIYRAGKLRAGVVTDRSAQNT